MKGFTLWLTGLSGAGKTTLANELEGHLLERGMKVEVLDGDVIRENFSKGLTFSREDRDIQVRRVGFVCNLLTRNDVVAIAALISPYADVRAENRKMIGRYVEVFCNCPIEVLKERDPKGLYKKALAGEIKNFTGIDDPYETPEDAEIECLTAEESIEESAQKVVKTLEILGYVPRLDEAEYSAEEEDKIRQRLEDLGYI